MIVKGKGKVIIVSAPSGAGKSTIVKHLRSLPFNLEFSVSATSREPRINEKNGIDYFFISKTEFKRKIKNNEFLEWEEVYPGVYYGTLKEEINRILKNGKNVIFDVDVVGGLDLKRIFKNNALIIFVVPPYLDILKERLIARSTETDEKIAVRLAKASSEIEFSQFDVVLINDDLEESLIKAEQFVRKFFMKHEFPS